MHSKMTNGNKKYSSCFVRGMDSSLFPIQYIDKGIVEQNKLNQGGNNILSYQLLGSDKTFHWRLVFG